MGNSILTSYHAFGEHALTVSLCAESLECPTMSNVAMWLHEVYPESDLALYADVPPGARPEDSASRLPAPLVVTKETAVIMQGGICTDPLLMERWTRVEEYRYRTSVGFEILVKDVWLITIRQAVNVGMSGSAILAAESGRLIGLLHGSLIEEDYNCVFLPAPWVELRC